MAGRVKVFKSTPAGKEIILEIFGAGDPLGAVAVYESVPFFASAIALEPTQTLSIEQAAFFRLLEHDPAFVRGLLSGLTIRLAELTRRLADLSGARVDVRLARLFLKLCDRIGRQERGGIFVPMPLSRQELADLAGTTIETTIRIMSRWQKEDVLHTEKDGFVVLEPRRARRGRWPAVLSVSTPGAHVARQTGASRITRCPRVRARATRATTGR